jgi:DNA-binding XRE family transcriptional regulator
MDKQLFRTLMEFHSETQLTLAEFLGINRVTVSVKINSGSFTQAEIKALADKWQLTPEQVMAVFFNG